ncbi:D-alanyl-D-alanine carboxypeptidase family protein [Taklimakanibacter lacteus]|uniref:D-alanyl-D-alanine carboxypeptidase family protein n=1 Tax=Taklimakanibacter lacteus TaxID=2268456 RepID=UPI0013C417CA
MAGPSLLFDAATGEVVSQDRAGEPWYPASLTKLMTAYVIFEKLKRGEMTPDQKLAVSQLASSQPASKVGMKPGTTITVDLAVQMLLIYSANDMAYVLAEGASGNYQEFVKLMNAEAKRLGMTATHYANPNGLFDARQVTSARDIGVLATALLRDFPEHAHYFSQADVALGKRKLLNRNSLLRKMKTADGMKTGFVCNSGFNLVASATDNGRKLIAIVLGASGGRERADLAEMMLTSGFAKPPQPQQMRLSAIANAQLGTLVPADLTQTVCKGKPTAIARASGLTGWGVSFGSYDKPATADMALRGRLLGARDMIQNSTAGVVRIPGTNGYSAMVWDLDQAASLSVCAAFKKQNSYCDVMTPEGFASIANLARATEERIVPAASQGDAGMPRKKKKAKRKKN